MQLTEMTMKNKYIILAEDVLFRRVGNEGVLLYLPTGTYYSLNETSILFWEALSKGSDLELTIDQITDEYEVDRAQVVQDLQEFLTDLQAYGLISQNVN
jgi:hypothetical protein